MDRIRVMVAEDEDAVLDVLSDLIASDSSLRLIGTARDAETAIELAAHERPDVALLDVRMPGGGGPRAAREIARRSPPTKMIALSAFEDVDTVLTMLRAGADTYVAKSDPTDEILRAIRRTVQESSSAAPTDVAIRSIGDYFERRDHGSTKKARSARRRIREVLESRAVTMAFRPVFDLSEGTTAGAEAVPRFKALPSRAPDSWFAEAQSVGMLLDLELATTRAALARLRQLPADHWLALCLSPQTARAPELLEALHGTPMDRVVLQLSEHAPVDDYAELKTALAGVRDMGVRMAITDAGASFTNLRHIVQLVPDFIKIDVELTRDIGADPIRQVLVMTLASFGSQIGASVIVEGIGSQEELDALLPLGVRYAQGDHLGRPGPIPRSGNWEAVTVNGRPGRADNSKGNQGRSDQPGTKGREG